MNNLDARAQYLAGQQQSMASAFNHAGLAGLAGQLGSFGGFVGAIPGSAFRAPPPPKPTCRIGKVTPKPGFILDIFHPDRVRVKVLADYSRWERLLIWWHSLD